MPTGERVDKFWSSINPIVTNYETLRKLMLKPSDLSFSVCQSSVKWKNVKEFFLSRHVVKILFADMFVQQSRLSSASKAFALGYMSRGNLYLL
jgi:hypothetical protein